MEQPDVGCPGIPLRLGAEEWIVDGPHLMVIVPDTAMLAGFPTEAGTGRPYVMWSGTPFAHLMVPTTRAAGQ